MSFYKADIRVPPHLLPLEFDGYSPALSIYATTTLEVSSSNVTINGEAFPYVGKSLTLLAAEINRTITAIRAVAHMKTSLLSGDLLLYNDDETPEGGRIIRFQGFSLKATEKTRIGLLKPHTVSSRSAWWARINRGSFRKNINGVNYTFAIPEFINQNWSPEHGRPYKDTGNIEARVVDPYTVKLPHKPIIFSEGLVSLTINGHILPPTGIEDVDENNGLVFLVAPIDINHRVIADYVYREESYAYKGINLNPTLQHNPSIIDRFVVFYMVPAWSSSGLTSKTTIRHIVGTTIDDAVSRLSRGVAAQTPKALLGAIRVRQPETASDVAVYDARRPGGGVREDIDATSIETEAQYFSDIGNFDGTPYPGNAALVITLPEAVLDVFSEEQVRDIVGQHTALGTAEIVEFD